MLLSICIPSYNRFDELKVLLYSISKSASQDFNVYVVDNGSKGDIFSIEQCIRDSRIKFVQRENSVPGATSCRTCLDYGDGTYRMLCLDKDIINGEYLDDFIVQLKESTNVSCGHCVLNSKNTKGILKIQKDSTKKNIYLCGHPTGYFVRNDVLVKEQHIIDHYNNESIYYNNPFAMDLLYAQGLLMGREAIYEGQLIKTEELEKAKSVKSYTYSVDKNNIYFFPENRKRQFLIFCKHLQVLGIEDSLLYEKIVTNLYFQTLSDCTFRYRNIMKNQAICQHHGIESENITIRELFIAKVNFEQFFYECEDVHISKHKKKKCINVAKFVFMKGLLNTFWRR